MIVPGKDGQAQQTIDMSQTTQVQCEKCENSTFKQTLLIRKMSALVSPNGQETIIPMQVFACEKCGHVNKEFSDIDGIMNLLLINSLDGKIIKKVINFI